MVIAPYLCGEFRAGVGVVPGGEKGHGRGNSAAKCSRSGCVPQSFRIVVQDLCRPFRAPFLTAANEVNPIIADCDQ